MFSYPRQQNNLLKVLSTETTYGNKIWSAFPYPTLSFSFSAKSKARPRQPLSRASIKALKDPKGLLGNTLSPLIETIGDWKIPIE